MKILDLKQNSLHAEVTDLVAQWIEHRLAEPGAAGSNPAEITGSFAYQRKTYAMQTKKIYYLL